MVTGSPGGSSAWPVNGDTAGKRAARSRSPAWSRWRVPSVARAKRVALAVRSGKRVVAVSRTENPGALYLFGGAFDAVVGDPRELREPRHTILYVTAAPWRRVEARRRGMRAAAPEDLATALGPRSLAAPRASLPTILAA